MGRAGHLQVPVGAGVMTCTAKPDCTGKGPFRRGMCNRHYANFLHKQKGYGRFESMLTDAGPARAHVLELQAAGMGARRIAELSGVARSQVQQLLRGRVDRGLPAPRQMSRANSDRLLAVQVPLLADGAQIPAFGCTRRLQALVAAGWSQTELSERLGMVINNLNKLTRGRQQMCTTARARQIKDLFDQLQMQRGPSNRAALLGRRMGWALPLEWDEESIDDPDASPARARRRSSDAVSARRLERIEKVRELTDAGLSAADIGERLGVSQRTVVRLRSEVAA